MYLNENGLCSLALRVGIVSDAADAAKKDRLVVPGICFTRLDILLIWQYLR